MKEELSSGPQKVKVVSNSVLDGRWGLGTTSHVVYVPGEVTYDAPEISDLSKSSTFTLEEYTNVTPDPNILPKEVDITQTSPFLLTNPGFLLREYMMDTEHILYLWEYKY